MQENTLSVEVGRKDDAKLVSVHRFELPERVGYISIARVTYCDSGVDKNLRDRRAVVAWMVGGAELERSADRFARDLTKGLNARDVLLLAALVFDRGGTALPTELIGTVHTTSAGVSGSLKRLTELKLVSRSIGDDGRTRPIVLTSAGQQLIEEIVEPWQAWFENALKHLSSPERSELYRLLVKASGLWNGVWPDEATLE
jgi:DNA-binding MarR family transcriptional regulator